MSKENAKQFLNEFRNNKEAMELLKGYPKAKTHDESIRQIAEVAGKMGIQVTVEEMSEASNELREERKAQTDDSVNKMQKLNDTDLENVDGGFYYIKRKTGTTKVEFIKVYDSCLNDFEDTDCLRNDACNASTNYYYDCFGEMFANDGENDCTADFYCDIALKWR